MMFAEHGFWSADRYSRLYYLSAFFALVLPSDGPDSATACDLHQNSAQTTCSLFRVSYTHIEWPLRMSEQAFVGFWINMK